MTILILAAFLCGQNLFAQERTLRVDYTFTGTDRSASIAVDELKCFDGWAGRRVNLADVPLQGNGQVLMTSHETGDTLYRQAFSTLFQEWQATEEATRTCKSFEAVFLFPMPEGKADIKVELYDFHGATAASLVHMVDPQDILIRKIPASKAPYKYIRRGGDPATCIDVAIVAEGYKASESGRFYRDAKDAVDAILSHEPFGKFADRFNFVAVALPSQESGVSIPGKGVWKKTPLSSHFNTFYSDRYLTTLHVKDLHDALCGIPYEHIIILANTDNYGGGGIFNSYTLTTAHHSAFKPVVVHEFGHSFAGLGDEYYYDDQYTEYYYPDTEPWEPNITTMKDFASKWQDMVEEGTAGVFEGGGYQSKGVWRGAENCRMKTNGADGFCAVCRRAIERIIRFYTE